MKFLVFFLLLSFEPAPGSLIDDVATSGRCASLSETPDARVASSVLLVPGPPPLLSFRTYEGRLHQRFANSDLMLDDAGH